jgi:hypothetical protein
MLSKTLQYTSRSYRSRNIGRRPICRGGFDVHVLGCFALVQSGDTGLAEDIAQHPLRALARKNEHQQGVRLSPPGLLSPEYRAQFNIGTEADRSISLALQRHLAPLLYGKRAATVNLYLGQLFSALKRVPACRNCTHYLLLLLCISACTNLTSESTVFHRLGYKYYSFHAPYLLSYTGSPLQLR